MQSTGNTRFDSLFGALLKGDNVVWHDRSGSLSSDFFLSFISSSLNEKVSVVYVSFDRSPNNLIKKLGPLAEDPGLIILDCFTYGKGDGSDLFVKFYSNGSHKIPGEIISLKNPGNQDAFLEALESAYQACSGKVNFVFESLTGMQDLWGSEESILKLYTRTCPRLYELNTIAYWVLERDAHTKRLKASINQIAQVVIELDVKRGKSFVTISKAENRETEHLNKPHLFWTQNGEIQFGRRRELTGGRYNVGARIKSFRKASGISQTELAKQVGVTPSTISQMESGQIYPSIPGLVRISELLSMDIASFFQDTGDGSIIMYAESDASDIEIKGASGKEVKGGRLMPAGKNSRFSPFLIEFEPGAVLNSHFFNLKNEEFGYLVSGKLEVNVNNEKREVKTGTFINLEKHIPSQWKNTGGRRAKLLWITLN